MIPTRPATADEQRAFGLAQVKLAEGDDVLQPEALDTDVTAVTAVQPNVDAARAVTLDVAPDVTDVTAIPNADQRPCFKVFDNELRLLMAENFEPGSGISRSEPQKEPANCRP